MNPNTLAALELLGSESSTPAVTPSAGIPEILGRNLANLIPSAINSLGGSLEGVLNLGASPESMADVPEMPMWATPPALTEAATGGEKLTNLLTGSIAPEILALLAPYLGVTKLTKAAGVGKVGQVIAGNVAQGAVGGIKYGPEEAIEGAALGGALSGIGTVPGVLRRAAITAPIAGLEYAIHADEGLPQAATAAATSLIGGILPSISGGGAADVQVLSPKTPLALPFDPRRVSRTIPTGDVIYSHPSTNTYSGQLALPGPATSPDARYWNMLEWPHGEARTFTPSGEPILMTGPERIAEPIKRAAYETPVIGEGGYLTNLLRSAEVEIIPPREVAWIDAEMPGLALQRGVPRSNVKPPPVIDVSQLPSGTFEVPASPSMVMYRVNYSFRNHSNRLLRT
jgi:hypothetical protein